MVDKYKWVLDTREKNAVFLGMASDEEFIKKRLTLSFFIPLKPGMKDMDAGDFSNENADGMVEFKSYADMIGSTTGDGVHHLEEQVIKMYASGMPFAVIVYGTRWLFKKQSNVSDEFILQGLQKLMKLSAVYKFSVCFVENEKEALETAKTFLRKCRELPRRMPVYNLLKQTHDEPVAMLCGVEGIGEKTGISIMEKWGTLTAFMERLIDQIKYIGIEGAAESIADETPGLGVANAKKIIRAITIDVTKRD